MKYCVLKLHGALHSVFFGSHISLRYSVESNMGFIALKIPETLRTREGSVPPQHSGVENSTVNPFSPRQTNSRFL